MLSMVVLTIAFAVERVGGRRECVAEQNILALRSSLFSNTQAAHSYMNDNQKEY